MSGRAGHDELWAVCHVHGLKYEIWPPDDPGTLPHCYRCRFFHELGGRRAFDWGVCFNPLSPRAGLLTFEHMGCHQHEGGEVERSRSLKRPWLAQRPE